MFLYRDSGIDILRGIDGNALIGWVTNYCRQHPLDQLQVGIEKLITDLRQRAERSR